MHTLRTAIKKYMLTGLLVLVPLALTWWVLLSLFHWTDRTLRLIPPMYRPEALIGFPIPGLGLILTVAIIFVIGALVANVAGRKLISTGEKILEKIPLLRWFYFSTKQIMEAVFVKGQDSFRRAILLEYPRKGIYSIGFITGEARGEIKDRIPGRSMTIFVPTTPNPTSGYLVVVPENELIPLNWSVDEAFRMIISAGVVMPGDVSNFGEVTHLGPKPASQSGDGRPGDAQSDPEGELEG
ncbi:MAG: DUF502 domain-containing protein [bacterium]|nr:DUF502 domain-containing protein [bacterium]